MTYIYKPPENTPLDILYQDSVILVVNKPAGLLSVPGKGEDRKDCMERRIKQYFAEALTVHRLDMATSGIMVFARNKRIHRRLSMQFQAREVNKCYIAIVTGIIENLSGRIDFPIRADWQNRPVQIINVENGKHCITHFKVLWKNTENNATGVELRPVTGRTHQLRLHMQAIGHPILGDRLYNPVSSVMPSRLMLHALSLSFQHPQTGESVHFVTEAPF